MPKNDDGESREADAASTNSHARPPERQRVAKLMARAGLCSRRDAEVWISEGRVALNGAVLSSPAMDVGADDTVLVDGLPLPEAEKTRLFLFHKPRGLVTSDHDPEGRPTVADHLRAAWPEGPRVVTVGRLDINTEGLLLLTNDGGLARVLELPQTGWVRRYRVRAKGQTDQAVLDGLRDGVTIEGVAYAGIEARLDRVQGSNCWLTMGLREGKNREVKRVLEHVGLEVNRLIRLSFGPFQLGDLPDGEVSEVKTRILRDQLGEALATRAGVDFHEDDVVQASPDEQRPRPTRDEPNKAKQRGGARIVAAPRRATGSSVATAGPRGSNRRDPRRDDRRDPTGVTPAKRERPLTGPRKHVSLLRAEPSAEGRRKRVERTSTRDRADREIVVERVRETPSRAEARASSTGMERPSLPRPSASKTAAARARAADAVRRDDEGAPRRDEPHRRGTGGGKGGGKGAGTSASPSARGKRERVLRSGGASRDVDPRHADPRHADPRHDARERPSDQKRPRGGSQARHRVGRGAAPAGEDRGVNGGHRPARARPAAMDRPGTKRPGADRPRAVRDSTSTGRQDRAPRERPLAGKPSRDADRPMTRERPGGERQRAPRFEGSERGAARRGDGAPGGGRTARTGKGPAPGGRPGASDISGHGPRGRFAGGKAGGGKTGGGKAGGGKAGGGGKGSDGKAGGGRPAGRPKR